MNPAADSAAAASSSLRSRSSQPGWIGIIELRWDMPEISRFFGMVIAMYYYDHAPPHFYVGYGRQKAVAGIDPLTVLARRRGPRPRCPLCPRDPPGDSLVRGGVQGGVSRAGDVTKGAVREAVLNARVHREKWGKMVSVHDCLHTLCLP